MSTGNGPTHPNAAKNDVLILIDTSVWIAYLRNPRSQDGQELESLLTAGRALLTGVVIGELLQGVKLSNQRDEIRFRLHALPYQELDKDGWTKLGLLAAELRQNGFVTGITDLIIATLAIEGGHEVYTLDADFQRIPDVKLHTPGA